MTSDLLRVFVYGSLRMGGDNHHLLGGAAPIGNGTIEGDLYVSGNLSTVQEGGGTVHGEVYQLPDRNHLRSLDDLEGHPVWYKRRVVAVTLVDGTKTDAWCYARAEPDPQGKRLEHGDYLRFRNEAG